MGTADTAALNPVQLALQAIERFLQSSRSPQLLEPGEPALPLREGLYSLTPSGRWLMLEAWDQNRVLSRRIAGVKQHSTGRLELITQRFGGKPGSLFLLDAARSSNDGLCRKAHRLIFGEQFRQMVRHQFNGWRIVDFSTGANLEESLSPSYPRAFTRKGARGWAVMAAPPDSDVDGMLSFALIWLDYLRRRERKVVVEGVAVFLPYGLQRTTALRLLHLHPGLAQYSAFAYTGEGHTLAIDLRDFGNLDTKLEAKPVPRPARQEPEAIMEAQVRSYLPFLDSGLRPEPVYGQVPTVAGTDHGILDLLSVGFDGRLAVIELKATESIHLPLQALDYWMRVKWHLDRGDFARQGYFPGIALSPDPPRLLLAAPALRFHSTNERILGFFRAEIEVDRIGLAESWGGPVRVMFRHSRPTIGG
ncbi:MAG TPA: hypothetical protein VM120_03065 [Bryobacteraceae bacterium]|nr:hypothetical protein [Bryobacteraceae bacterium]